MTQDFGGSYQHETSPLIGAAGVEHHHNEVATNRWGTSKRIVAALVFIGAIAIGIHCYNPVRFFCFFFGRLVWVVLDCFLSLDCVLRL